MANWGKIRSPGGKTLQAFSSQTEAAEYLRKKGLKKYVGKKLTLFVVYKK